MPRAEQGERIPEWVIGYLRNLPLLTVDQLRAAATYLEHTADHLHAIADDWLEADRA